MDKIIKLQNLLFPKQDLEQHWWMFYRGDKFSHNVLESAYCLEEEEHAEFLHTLMRFQLKMEVVYKYKTASPAVDCAGKVWHPVVWSLYEWKCN